MKLRIKGNSLRFRITQPDMEKLIDSGRIEEVVYFATDDEAMLGYALRHETTLPSPTLIYDSLIIEAALPTHIAREWAATMQVGIYFSVNLGTRGVLNLIVEKDFACLDPGDDDVVGTFPNPNAGTAC